MKLLLANHQMWVILIGAIVPLGGYILNRFAPWTSESAKAIIQVLLAAIAGALYTALDTSVFGWNSATIELVLSAIAAALMAHNWLYRPAKINTKLGATETTPVRE